jgi:hypothetical protein
LLFLKKFIKNAPEQKLIPKKDYSGLIYLIPPILPLFVYGFLQIFGVPQVRSFLIGIIISIILVFYLTNGSRKDYFRILKKSISFNLVLKDLIIGSNIPVISMIIIIPLVLGILTGYNLGAVALSYPILAPFFPSDISLIVLVSYTSLIFISSLIGYIISPIHLCNVVSSDYLKTDTTRMYRIYIPAAFIMLIIQIIVIGTVIYFSNLI